MTRWGDVCISVNVSNRRDGARTGPKKWFVVDDKTGSRFAGPFTLLVAVRQANQMADDMRDDIRDLGERRIELYRQRFGGEGW